MFRDAKEVANEKFNWFKDNGNLTVEEIVRDTELHIRLSKERQKEHEHYIRDIRKHSSNISTRNVLIKEELKTLSGREARQFVKNFKEELKYVVIQGQNLVNYIKHGSQVDSYVEDEYMTHLEYVESLDQRLIITRMYAGRVFNTLLQNGHSYNKIAS